MFPSGFSLFINTFDFIHMDIWEPLSIRSLHGRYTWISIVHNKLETRKLMHDFIFFVQNQFNTTIKTIRSSEFAYTIFVC